MVIYNYHLMRKQADIVELLPTKEFINSQECHLDSRMHHPLFLDTRKHSSLFTLCLKFSKEWTILLSSTLMILLYSHEELSNNTSTIFINKILNVHQRNASSREKKLNFSDILSINKDTHRVIETYLL